MDKAKFLRIVRKHGGWIESGAAMFPSPHLARLAEKEIAASDAKRG